MPVTLSQIANNESSIVVTGGVLGESVVNLVYYPGHVTEEVFGTLNMFSAMNDENILSSFASFNETLASIIKSWDVMEDDKVTMFPIDPARFPKLPISFRMQVLNAIMGDIRPESFAPQTQNQTQTQN